MRFTGSSFRLGLRWICLRSASRCLLSPLSGWRRMPSGAAGPLWRMASGKPRSCYGPGSNSSGRKRPCKPSSMVTSARWLVTWSAAVARGFRTARPSTTRPQRARHDRPSQEVLRRVSGPSAPSVWRGLASWYGVRRPIRVKPTDRRAGSTTSTRSSRRTKRWSAIAVFPCGSYRREACNALGPAALAT